LGAYNGPGFTLTITSSSRLPSRETFLLLFIKCTMSLSPGSAAIGDAKVYLVSHNLLPTWSANAGPRTSRTGSLVFGISASSSCLGAGRRLSSMARAEPYGLELDVNNGSQTQVARTDARRPDRFHVSDHLGRSGVRSALVSSPSGTDAITPVPTVRLTSAQLVYVLVGAGDHSFYEPAFLFSGISRTAARPT